ncbi:MAG: metal ABC transporter substrate-binding protein [Phycisphaerales bacterium]
MNLRRTAFAIVAAIAPLGLNALAGAQAAQAPGTAGAAPTAAPQGTVARRVVVSIPPLRGIIEPLLPPGSTVEVLIPPGASEHGHEIAPAKLAALKKADIVFLVGMGLEPQVDKFLKANPAEAGKVRRELRVQALAGIEVEASGHDHEGHDHSGHDHAHHDHSGHDPHVWLDPYLVMKALPGLVKATAEGLPAEQAKDVAARGDVLLARLGKLDSLYRNSLATVKRKKVVVGHDAFSWLAKRYAFETVAVAGVCASEPTPGSIALAVKTVKDEKLPCVFSEPQLSSAAVKRVADRAGVPVRTLDPLGDGDYFKLMESNLDALLFALGGVRAAEKVEQPTK